MRLLKVAQLSSLNSIALWYFKDGFTDSCVHPHIKQECILFPDFVLMHCEVLNASHSSSHLIASVDLLHKQIGAKVQVCSNNNFCTFFNTFSSFISLSLRNHGQFSLYVRLWTWKILGSIVISDGCTISWLQPPRLSLQTISSILFRLSVGIHFHSSVLSGSVFSSYGQAIISFKHLISFPFSFITFHCHTFTTPVQLLHLPCYDFDSK